MTKKHCNRCYFNPGTVYQKKYYDGGKHYSVNGWLCPKCKVIAKAYIAQRAAYDAEVEEQNRQKHDAEYRWAIEYLEAREKGDTNDN